MPSKTLDHCVPADIPLNPAHSGIVEVTVGGMPGDGAVSMVASPGNEDLSVDTADQDETAVSQATQLTFHYQAKPAAPQSVQIAYQLS